jgi:membrane-bound inhibitor of C-type lysozyme
MRSSMQLSLDLSDNQRYQCHQQLLNVVVTQARKNALSRVIESLGTLDS